MNNQNPTTYADSGVDIDKADLLKNNLKKTLATSNTRILNSVGAFSSLYSLGNLDGIKDPVLCLKMEEPGSKQLLAAQEGRLASIGIDLINHLINDTIMNGGRPLAILDTIVCGSLDSAEVSGLIKVMVETCRNEGCDLVGGETSEQPGVIPKGTYILSAACIGIVDRSKIITGEHISVGDEIYAVASNGPHTNGYTLIRSLLTKFPELKNKAVGDHTFIDAVLKPHVCYNKPLQQIFTNGIAITGLAHITGGGVVDNLKRILPSNINADINLSLVKVLPIFSAIKAAGSVPDADMLRTFNCGVGMIFTAPKNATESAAEYFNNLGFNAYKIGNVSNGSGEVKCSGSLAF